MENDKPGGRLSHLKLLQKSDLLALTTSTESTKPLGRAELITRLNELEFTEHSNQQILSKTLTGEEAQVIISAAQEILGLPISIKRFKNSDNRLMRPHLVISGNENITKLFESGVRLRTSGAEFELATDHSVNKNQGRER